jgi:hypothetical protein
MHVRAFLIDPAEQKISPLCIPKSSDNKTLECFTGAPMEAAWITDRTKALYRLDGTGEALGSAFAAATAQSRDIPPQPH